MSTHKIDVKIFTEDGAAPPVAELIPVFHDWIQRRRIPDELLIDVANYAHVPEGPGVVLIGHEGHYGFDLGDGQPGLLYSQRRIPAVDFRAALTRALRHALFACSLLEAETGLSRRVRFRTDRWRVRINDRLHAPNEADTWQRFQPDCRTVVQQLLGERVGLAPDVPGRSLFGFEVHALDPVDLPVLLERCS